MEQKAGGPIVRGWDAPSHRAGGQRRWGVGQPAAVLGTELRVRFLSRRLAELRL